MTKLTPELCEELVARYAEGRPLKIVCQDEDMPSLRTVQRHRDADPAFDAMLIRARETWADSIAEEILSIIDEPCREKDTAHAMDKRVRAEVRLKLIAKFSPRKYSDAAERIGINIGIGGTPAAPLDELETVRRLAFLLAKGAHIEDQQARPKVLPALPPPRQEEIARQRAYEAFVAGSPAPAPQEPEKPPVVEVIERWCSDWNSAEQGRPNPWRSPTKRATSGPTRVLHRKP